MVNINIGGLLIQTFILDPYTKWVKKNSIEPPTPFPSMDQYFPRHQLLLDHWKIIQQEAMCLYDKGLTSEIKNDLFFRGIADTKWKKFYIKWFGSINQESYLLCPRTAKLIESLPELHIAMFSILEPGAVIPPHQGPCGATIRYHLGLKTPNSPSCSITLNGKPYYWKDGEDILFDDTYIHDVVNNTDQIRIILFCDVERKMKNLRYQKVNHFLCQKLGPLTTRQNDKNEIARYLNKE